MRVLVVDDEAPARRRLIRELLALPGIELAGEAEDGEQALAMVERVQPDLLLLDVRMPGLDGIALATRERHLPPIIFVTAHDEFAVRAFEVDALDYLLKPVRRERLAEALARAERRIALRGPRIVTFERGVSRFFEAQAIARFWSSDKYTVFQVDGEEHLTPEPLTTLADRLSEHGFRRIHRAELINVARVRALRPDGVVELDDGSTARVSRRSLPALREELSRR
ncbi:MAG: LytTR family DNA-binding domain-containing protein [Polyangiales bacterium]